jgi:hypothetical protein
VAIPSVELRTAFRRGVKPLDCLVHLWRRLAPARALILTACFHLIFSLAYIVVFSRAFNFGSRIVVLHLSIVASLILVTTLCLGSLLLVRRIREWRLAGLFLALVPATGSSLLAILYFVDYVGNSLWGNSINYELAAQYVFGGGIFQKELQLLPARAYLILGGGLVAIFSTYIALSGALFRSLEELFLPAGRLSLLRDGRRALRSGAGVLLGLLLTGGAGLLSTSVESPYRDRILLHEPLVSLFTNTSGLNDFISYSIRARLEAQEERVRASYPSGQSFQKKNVVVIMVDSLRADHMQVYGYERPTTPFLAELLETGRLKKVEVATSTCSDTTCGVMATLSSRPLGKQIPQSFKLPDLLHSQGYKIYFILSGSHRWYNLKDHYGINLDYYFDGANSAGYDWNDDRVIFEGLAKAPDFAGEPAFLYFHVMSPHSAGVKLEEYGKYRPAKNWVEFNRGEFDDAAIRNFYDNGVVQADAVIRGIFEGLKQKGYLDNSLVVILSDHGEALGRPDHSRYGHVNYLYQECIRIPLLIYDDAGAEYANMKYATQIDVAPTILDRLGLAVPSSWQGQSLLAAGRSRYSLHQTRTYPPSYALIYKTDRAIYKYLKHDALGEELYELVSDPRERHNLMNSIDPAIIEHMRERLAAGLADD